MSSDTSEFHPNIVEEFRRGTWYQPRDCAGDDRPVSPMLLSIFGSVLFAAIAVMLVAVFGGA